MGLNSVRVQPTTLRKSESAYSVALMVEQFIRYSKDIIQHSEETIKTRTSHLKFFTDYCVTSGNIDIRNINNILIDEFFVYYATSGRKGARNKTTVNTAKKTVQVFLRWVDGYKETPLRANPDAVRLVKVRDRTPKAINDNIVAKVINEATELQDSLIIATFRESGLRIGELVNLKVEDIIGNQLRVIGKGEVDRYVNITPTLSVALREFADESDRNGSDWLFQQVYKGYGDQMTIKGIRKRVQKCFMNIAGVKMTPHQLRHSMAIGLLRDGCDLVTIQLQLGHRDIQTTMTYLRIENSAFKEAYAKSMPKSFLVY